MGGPRYQLWEDRIGPKTAQATKWLWSIKTTLEALDEQLGDAVWVPDDSVLGADGR